MAARRSRKSAPRRRRSKQGVNLINAAQSYIVASAATQAFFGTQLAPFLTEGWLVKRGPATDNSWEMSAAEIVTGLLGGGFGTYTGGSSPYTGGTGDILLAVKRNLKTNGAKAVGVAIGAPIAFKLAKDLTKGPRRDANKLLKMAGLNTVVKV